MKNIYILKYHCHYGNSDITWSPDFIMESLVLTASSPGTDTKMWYAMYETYFVFNELWVNESPFVVHIPFLGFHLQICFFRLEIDMHCFEIPWSFFVCFFPFFHLYIFAVEQFGSNYASWHAHPQGIQHPQILDSPSSWSNPCSANVRSITVSLGHHTYPPA